MSSKNVRYLSKKEKNLLGNIESKRALGIVSLILRAKEIKKSFKKVVTNN